MRSAFLNRSIKDVRTTVRLRLWHQVRTIANHKFVVVRQKNAELAKLAYGGNYDQVMEAPVIPLLFTDTDLTSGSEDCACPVVSRTSQEQLQYFMQNYATNISRYNEQQISVDCRH